MNAKEKRIDVKPLPFALPEEILLEGSATALRTFSFENDSEHIYELLSDPRIASGGYKFNGLEINPDSTQNLQEEIWRRWGDGSYELMKIEHRGVFIGVTGVARQLTSSAPVTVLSGRTLLSPNVWGTSVNAEVKLALYGELFARGAGVVEVIVAMDNLRSMGSVTKFGFVAAEIVVSPMATGGVNLFRRLKLKSSAWEDTREMNLARIAQKRLLLH